jgi:hypothetical protein
VGKNFAVLDKFLWDIYRDTLFHNFFPNIKIDIWHPAVGLRCIIPPTSVKDLGNTLNLNPNWARTLLSLIYFSWVVYRVPPNPNIKVVYQDSSRHSLGEQRGAGHYACVTGSDLTGSGPGWNDVAWSHLTESDVITGSIFCACSEVHPRFFFLL